MDVEEFEQQILKLAFETDVRITTASVAYYLGVPSTKVEPMLEELLERGVLELDSDRDGNLYYRVVDAAVSDDSDLSELKHDRAVGIDGGVDRGAADDDAESPRAESVGEATVDGGGETPAYSPRTGPAGGTETRATAGESPGVAASGRQKGKATRLESVAESAETRRAGRSASDTGRASTDGSTGRTDPLAGVTRRQGATDAKLDSCGEDPVVVQAEAECEPRPFADSSPVVASCSEETAAQQGGTLMRTRGERSELRGRQAARASADSNGELAYRDQQPLEKPEHQPGMSLLLSLILCGTGQIYNGEVSKGIMMMVLCFLLWFVLLGWVVHIWSIVDSVVVAERINRQSGDQPNRTGPSRQLSSG